MRMANTDTDAHRADFEAWVLTEAYFGYEPGAEDQALARDDAGYADACVHAAWLGVLHTLEMATN
jgi:hypothetical protein